MPCGSLDQQSFREEGSKHENVGRRTPMMIRVNDHTALMMKKRGIAGCVCVKICDHKIELIIDMLT